jgi:mono/diheme cytochrome c family protein
MKARILAVLAIAVAAAAGATFWFGGYDIAATRQHIAVVYWLLDTGTRRAIKTRAKSIEVPPLGDPAQLERGAALFVQHCVQCHGAPGVAPEPFALGMTPSAANLVHTARTSTPAEIYWAVRHGLKLSGMPAWEFRMSDAELWAVVAFVRTLPARTPDDYRAFVRGLPALVPDARAAAGAPDAARGRVALHQYACATCHAIPGVVGATVPVGPPLDRIATRAFIAGSLPNTRASMIRWIREPQSVNPRSAMPDLGVSERDAADIAAYLATLR